MRLQLVGRPRKGKKSERERERERLFRPSSGGQKSSEGRKKTGRESGRRRLAIDHANALLAKWPFSLSFAFRSAVFSLSPLVVLQ